jgi:hypothetical protein
MNIKESLEEFYENLLGVEYPWLVESIRRDSKKREVTGSNSHCSLLTRRAL